MWSLVSALAEYFTSIVFLELVILNFILLCCWFGERPVDGQSKWAITIIRANRSLGGGQKR